MEDPPEAFAAETNGPATQTQTQTQTHFLITKHVAVKYQTPSQFTNSKTHLQKN